MSADAAFLAFFAGPFQRALEQTEIPGLPKASWDRKAAYLLWTATKSGEGVLPPPPVSDLTTDKPKTGGIFD